MHKKGSRLLKLLGMIQIILYLLDTESPNSITIYDDSDNAFPVSFMYCPYTLVARKTNINLQNNNTDNQL